MTLIAAMFHVFQRINDSGALSVLRKIINSFRGSTANNEYYTK